jgi:hypothetical protein
LCPGNKLLQIIGKKLQPLKQAKKKKKKGHFTEESSGEMVNEPITEETQI